MKITILSTLDTMGDNATDADLEAFNSALTASIVAEYPGVGVDLFDNGDHPDAPTSSNPVSVYFGDERDAGNDDEEIVDSVNRIKEGVFSAGEFWTE